jgi:hypothetical protein
LHAVIDDHVRVPYNSTGDDAWTVIELADEDPNDAGHTMLLTVGGRVPGSASCV